MTAPKKVVVPRSQRVPSKLTAALGAPALKVYLLCEGASFFHCAHVHLYWSKLHDVCHDIATRSTVAPALRSSGWRAMMVLQNSLAIMVAMETSMRCHSTSHQREGRCQCSSSSRKRRTIGSRDRSHQNRRSHHHHHHRSSSSSSSSNSRKRSARRRSRVPMPGRVW